MTNNRIFNLLIGLGIAVVLLLGWFLGVSPILDQVSAANLQTQGLESANTASAGRLATLKKQFAKITTLQNDLLKLQESIPIDADIPDFLAEINSLSAANGVSLTSLAVNDALAYVAPGAVVQTAPDNSVGDSANGASGATLAAPTPAPKGGLVAIPVKVTVTGPYAQVMAFVGALQKGTRLLFVGNLSVIASTTDSSFSGEIDGNIYALPLPAGVTADSLKPGSPTTVTPTPTATPTPTETSSPDPTENSNG